MRGLNRVRTRFSRQNSRNGTVVVLGMALGIAVLSAVGHLEAAQPESWAGRFHTHRLSSIHQAGETHIRVLAPSGVASEQRYPVVFLLPVEPGLGQQWGDPFEALVAVEGLEELPCFFVSPTFDALPWYADHPTNPALQQEAYFLETVLPYVERRYPVRGDSGGRFLIGFSKSGWGAWTLLLRHSDTFAAAVAWDAPMMVDRPNVYGMGPIFGTEARFREYQVTALLAGAGESFKRDGLPRLFLLGEGNFAEEHRSVHRLMQTMGIRHGYQDRPRRRHHWESGWLPDAVRAIQSQLAPQRSGRGGSSGD